MCDFKSSPCCRWGSAYLAPPSPRHATPVHKQCLDIPEDSGSLFRLIYPLPPSFPVPWDTIATTSVLSSITVPFVPPVTPLSLFYSNHITGDHPSPPLPLVPRLCPPSSLSPGGSQLEAAEQRNCLLSRVDFSGAPKLLCIDTLSERGCQSGPGHSQPPWSHL